jgi:SpoIIAA-like
MIVQMSGLPDGVVGFEACGKLAAEDYRDVVLPVIEKAAAAGDVRCVIVIRDFDGLTGGALWQDLKMGVEYLHGWKKIALVTDIGWMSHAADLFGWMTPGETKTYSLDRRDEAIAWVQAA